MQVFFMSYVNEFAKKFEEITEKDCLCEGLSSSVLLKNNIPVDHHLEAVTICPGPNLAYFSKVFSLEDMVSHIYGRKNILSGNTRPHMFIAELYLYIDYLKEQLKEDTMNGQIFQKKKYYASFFQNLRKGITYYNNITGMSAVELSRLIKDLSDAGTELDFLNYQYSILDESDCLHNPDPTGNIQ